MKQISENLYIDCDDYNIILCEKKIRKTGDNAGEPVVDKKGNPVFDTLGYYANYQQVCRKLNDIGMRKFIDNDWLDCVQFVEGAYDKMIEIVKDDRRKNSN